MNLEEVAERSTGKARLGYLRMDADKVGEAFRETAGNAARVLALSRLPSILGARAHPVLVVKPRRPDPGRTLARHQ